MIESFKHRGLRLLYEKDDRSGVPADCVERIRNILAALSHARRPRDLAIVTFRLHPLKGNRKGDWSIRVTGNYRITFRMQEGKILGVDLEDYH